MVDIENHNAISPCYGADEAEVEDEADGHDGAVEREEGRLPPAGPPQPRRKVRLGALHVAAPGRHDALIAAHLRIVLDRRITFVTF